VEEPQASDHFADLQSTIFLVVESL